MHADLGHFFLILALCVSALLATIPMVGSLRYNAPMMRLAKSLSYAMAITVSLSFFALVAGFVYNDFTIAYVANNSNIKLPLGYRIAATWGGHEGSLLLWVMMLGLWTATVARFSRSLTLVMRARVLAVMGMISFGFLAFTELTSNPFERLLPGFPVEGQDLNPLLQDIGLIIHPPMLYMGYVGFAVVFAFTVAALIGGNVDTSWAKWARPWTTVAWCFLTVGIALGSWWAYYELGWGGWWFWDPVENASFMPWLSGTALIHSLAATEKRGVFRLWTVLLSIMTFSLSMLGTFLVRSGVLTSVHAFANDPERGLFILLLLAIILGAALILVLWRGALFQSSARYHWFSREGFLLFNNVLILGACLVVFVGTLFPLLADVLNSFFAFGKFSVGAPYFNALFVPLTLALMALLGIGPWLNWRAHQPQGLLYRSLIWVIIAVLTGVGMNWLMAGEINVMVSLTIALGCWVMLGEGYTLWRQVRNKPSKFKALTKAPAWMLGMVLAHTGLVVSAVGVAATSFYSIEENVRMSEGVAVQVDGRTFEMIALERVPGPNYDATRATIKVEDGDKTFTMQPEKRLYLAQQMPMTQVALKPSLGEELYVAMGEQLPDGSWAMRIQVKPLIRWIWLGALMMAFGGVLAIADRRYRAPSKLKQSGQSPKPSVAS